MTATLIAELLILTVGTYMDTDLVKEFCMFAKVAVIVDYILEMTFVIAVLSIDIKRVEVFLTKSQFKCSFLIYPSYYIVG
jgi:hypothetical protein